MDWAHLSDVTIEIGSNPMMEKRDFVGLIFECCNVYARAYINRERTAYTAQCPRCGKPARIRIAKNGSRDRFFKAG